MAKISILGTGGFGVSLAATCFRYGHEVTLWGLFQQEVDAIIRDGEHKKLLPGVPVNPGIRVTADISETAGADLVILAVPSFAVRETAARVRPFLSPETVVVNVAKGLEKGSCKLLSEVIEEEIPDRAAIILSGPSHAEEIARGVPTTIDAASKSRANAEYVQDVLSNDRLRIYVCDDIIGAQLGGALKNIIAVCAGMCDGMGLGDNAKAALMTRGLAEIARLGSAMGADSRDFCGLDRDRGSDRYLHQPPFPQLPRRPLYRPRYPRAGSNPPGRYDGRRLYRCRNRMETGAGKGCRDADRRTAQPCSGRGERRSHGGARPDGAPQPPRK